MSGKRKAIGDESLLTTVKMLNDVQETEPAIEERQKKKRKVANKRGSWARVESSDESEVDLQGEETTGVEMLDCIEVKW